MAFSQPRCPLQAPLCGGPSGSVMKQPLQGSGGLLWAALQGGLRRGSQPRLLSPARTHTRQLLPEQVSGGSTQVPLPGDTPTLWPQSKSMTLEKCWLTPAQGSGRPL